MRCGSVLVAYSGGVDSAYLAVTAPGMLGDRALCVTADSPSYPDHHRDLAIGTARAFSLRHEMVATSEVEHPEYRANPANRCYYCKHELYTHLTAIARARGFAAVVDGSNARRPRRLPARAARRRASSASSVRWTRPGLTKDEIRELARRAGMSDLGRAGVRVPVVADSVSHRSRPRRSCGRSTPPSACCATSASACAACAITTPSRGSSWAARRSARALEPDVAATIDRELRALGYAHVTIDLRGYRLGSLNEALKLRPV
mgnify:CR=1 FL=1